MKTHKRLLLLLSVCMLGAALAALAQPLPAVLRLGRGELTLADARQGVLREQPGDDGLRARWVTLAQVPEAALLAIVEAEDHRLRKHHGVDVLGIARASWLDLRAGRVVSGASTLAMQLARLVYRLPRTPLGKLEQAARALVLQTKLGPDGVLEAWLNLAPFGRDVRGIAEASRVYFGKPLRDLTRAEAIALACLPRAPSSYDIYRHTPRLLARRKHVLSLLQTRGLLSRQEQEELAQEPLSLVRFARPFRAPHAAQLAEQEARRRGGHEASSLQTTLDPTLQRAAEWACARVESELEDRAATGCASVVMSVQTGELRALVGSPGFFSADAGQVNAAVMPRQPGSALKPFLYALAFEQGKSPESTIVDEPARFAAQFGDWLPENYDHRYHGEITLRQALACSYNVPAAKLVASLGVSRVLERLRRLGLATLHEDAEHYGVGLSLGVGEVTLLDLVAAYGALARGGEYLAPTVLRSVEHRGQTLLLSPRRRERVFSPEVSRQITDVLSDNDARRPAFGRHSVLELPFPVAVKTGTSSHYRDNWTLGYAGDSVVGVWVGRHDGKPMHGVSGVSGAGPAFRHLMLTAEGKRETLARQVLPGHDLKVVASAAR